MNATKKSLHCRCICHDGYGGAHPNQKCPCKGGPENEWTWADVPRAVTRVLSQDAPKETK